MDDATRTRIANYRSAVSLPDDASLDVVREAVRLAEPDDVRGAAVLLHAAARHVGWAAANGYTVSARKMFSPACVAASITAAQAASAGSVSPYRSRLNQLSRAVAGGKAVTDGKSVTARSSSLTRPYTPAELTALRVAARGMGVEEQRDLEAAVALGVGAGMVGPPASHVRGEHVIEVGGHTVVCGPGFGPVIVREPWGSIVRQMASLRSTEPLTNYYTTGGRQRVRRGLGRSPHLPKLQAHRLRTGWLTDLLSAGVPLDVVAQLADISIVSLHPYLALSSPPAQTVEAAPDGSPFTGLEQQPGAPAPEQRSVAAILESQQPGNTAVAALWSSAEAEPLRKRVGVCATTSQQAKDLLTALFVLLEWALDQPGLPVVPEALLKETTLARWAAVQRKQGRAEASVAAYLARLRRLARPSAAEPAQATPVVAAAYLDAERQALITASDPSNTTLPDRLRRFLAAHVHAQLGAGIAGHEVARSRGTDVHRDARGTELQVSGTSPRVVAVRGVHARELEQLAQAVADEPLTGVTGHDLKRHRDAISQHLGITLDPARLQATWVADQVRADAPAHDLTVATGLTLAALAPLIVAAAEPRPLAELIAWSGWTP